MKMLTNHFTYLLNIQCRDTFYLFFFTVHIVHLIYTTKTVFVVFIRVPKSNKITLLLYCIISTCQIYLLFSEKKILPFT